MGDEDRMLLKTLCWPLKDLAKALDVPYSTLRNWSSGSREIPENYIPVLAALMRSHGLLLQAAAKELEHTSRKGRGENDG